MRVHNSRLAIIGLAAGSLLFQAAIAHAAMDPKKVADAIVAAATAGGESKITYAKAAASGNDVVITTFKSVNNDGDSFEIPSLVVTNPTERQPGGFTAAKVTFDKAKMTPKDVKDPSFTWNTGSMETVIVPAPDEIKEKAKITPFTKLALGGISVTGAEMKAPVSIASVGIELGAIKEGVPHDFKMSTDGITLPAALFSDAKSKAMLTQLGYNNGFNAKVTMTGTYVSETDTFTLTGLTLSADQVGTLTIATTVSGVPLSKLGSKEKAQELASTAMVNAASIRFDNAGVVERVLDMQAKSTGVDRKAFVASMAPALPFLLTAVFPGEAFRTKFAAAAGTFLDNPKSFALVSAPAAPVPVMQVLGAALNMPEQLPDMLSLDVKANQ